MAETNGELLDAREAMSVLGINEAELQTMVARGDLRAFRSAGTMKFRRDDVVGIKTEKKTEPTIIMPPAAQKAKVGSGILPTVSSAKPQRGSSRNLPAIKPAAGKPAATIPAKGAATPPADAGTSSDVIMLEDFELAPAEGESAANTQQVTASQTAVGSGGLTVVDGVDTSNMTVAEPGVTDMDTASATASAIAPVAVTTTSSGRQKVPSSRLNESAAAPAMSRVRAAVSATSQSSATKRAQATVTARPAGPLVTLGLIVTAFISMLSVSIIAVAMFKGAYDPNTGQRVIPSFLSKMPLINYETTYNNLPGNPADNEGEHKRPSDEFPNQK